MAENETVANVKSEAKDLHENAENKAEKATNEAKHEGHHIGHQIAQSASYIADKAKSHLSEAKDFAEKEENKLHHLFQEHSPFHGKIHEIGDEGRHKAVEAVNNVAKIVDQTAELVAENLGSSYGDYMHKASKHISKLSKSLKDKKLADITKGGHNIIRRNPVVSVGVAAALGYALYRFASHKKHKCEENHACDHHEASASSSDSSHQDS
ncbi:MAG: hypothetical protein ABF760_02625 [Zymomonas mobilis]|uniref:ElaB/YqjD/DUF883 family membrane-anchored ribosome-binding protein n=1 Tax=Zymomonas mobilis TaxID=542 RepID=A0A542W2W0_ZYMMB|nr:hypothetical protein [Zymomonas mobilis]TQL17916.1 hypothetical protein FBY58_1529 [Zymomonas mobilis]